MIRLSLSLGVWNKIHPHTSVAEQLDHPEGVASVVLVGRSRDGAALSCGLGKPGRPYRQARFEILDSKLRHVIGPQARLPADWSCLF